MVQLVEDSVDGTESRTLWANPKHLVDESAEGADEVNVVKLAPGKDQRNYSAEQVVGGRAIDPGSSFGTHGVVTRTA